MHAPLSVCCNSSDCSACLPPAPLSFEPGQGTAQKPVVPLLAAAGDTQLILRPETAHQGAVLH